MSEPRFKKHLDYAKANDSPVCRRFLSVSMMYMRSADEPTFGVLLAVAEELEREMQATPSQKETA